MKRSRIKELENKVAQMEILIDLLILSINNLMEAQGMEQENLDSGKWYSTAIDNQE